MGSPPVLFFEVARSSSRSSRIARNKRRSYDRPWNHDNVKASRFPRSVFRGKTFKLQHKPRVRIERFDENGSKRPMRGKAAMISTWSEWKRYPRQDRGANIVAPIGP